MSATARKLPPINIVPLHPVDPEGEERAIGAFLECAEFLVARVGRERARKLFFGMGMAI